MLNRYIEREKAKCRREDFLAAFARGVDMDKFTTAYDSASADHLTSTMTPEDEATYKERYLANLRKRQRPASEFCARMVNWADAWNKQFKE